MSVPPSTRTVLGPRRRLRRLATALTLTAVAISGTAVVATTSTASTAAAGSAGSGAGWDLVDTEDFSRLDRDRWHVYDGRTMAGNDTARPWRVRCTVGRSA